MNPHSHDPEDCPRTRCRYCSSDRDVWLIGQIVTAPFVAFAWMARRQPAAALVLAAVTVTVAAVAWLLVL